jgi:hypothetical protein
VDGETLSDEAVYYCLHREIDLQGREYLWAKLPVMFPPCCWTCGTCLNSKNMIPRNHSEKTFLSEAGEILSDETIFNCPRREIDLKGIASPWWADTFFIEDLSGFITPTVYHW